MTTRVRDRPARLAGHFDEYDPTRRVKTGPATVGDAVADLRLMLALARDEQPTDAELAARLDVYEEFGR